MSEFLEILKVRHAECLKRFQAKQAQLNAVNAEFQAVSQEFNSIQTLLNLELRKQQMDALARNVATTQPAAPQAAPAQLPAAVPTTAGEVNKTETVRELLRQHESGMTPTELWKQQLVRNQFHHRAYLYSVLKRLKDKGDVIERRGKYFFKFLPKPEENKEQNILQ